MEHNQPVVSNSPVADRLFSPGKKRILTLDGGGVRGIVSIAFLKNMEKMLRDQTGKKDLVLAEVFDLIAGTSVGSMIATMLAIGKSVEDIEIKFRDLAPKIFSGRETIFGQKRFNATPLVNGVRSIVGNLTLGSEQLQTGLVIIAKRADTDSVWVMSNNPNMPFYEDGQDYDGNKHYKLETLIRASTAAPFLFTPAKITIHTDRFGNKETGWFVDGGVTPHNNPALQALLMAALPSYHLGWKLSPDDLLLISVGAGAHRTPIDRNKKVLQGLFLRKFLSRKKREDIEEAAFAAHTLKSLINNCSQLTLKMMQSLSNPRFHWTINSEIGSLEDQILLKSISGLSSNADPRGIMRFQRYDLPLERGRLVDADFDVDASQEERISLHPIDEPKNIDRLYELAEQAAQKQVRLEDFEGFIPAQ